MLINVKFPEIKLPEIDLGEKFNAGLGAISSKLSGCLDTLSHLGQYLRRGAADELKNSKAFALDVRDAAAEKYAAVETKVAQTAASAVESLDQKVASYEVKTVRTSASAVESALGTIAEKLEPLDKRMTPYKHMLADKATVASEKLDSLGKKLAAYEARLMDGFLSGKEKCADFVTRQLHNGHVAVSNDLSGLGNLEQKAATDAVIIGEAVSEFAKRVPGNAIILGAQVTDGISSALSFEANASAKIDRALERAGTWTANAIKAAGRSFTDDIADGINDIEDELALLTPYAKRAATYVKNDAAALVDCTGESLRDGLDGSTFAAINALKFYNRGVMGLEDLCHKTLGFVEPITSTISGYAASVASKIPEYAASAASGVSQYVERDMETAVDAVTSAMQFIASPVINTGEQWDPSVWNTGNQSDGDI